jgi:hypothetical protein
MENAKASGGLYARRPACQDKPGGSPGDFPKLESLQPAIGRMIPMEGPSCRQKRVSPVMYRFLREKYRVHSRHSRLIGVINRWRRRLLPAYTSCVGG